MTVGQKDQCMSAGRPPKFRPVIPGGKMQVKPSGTAMSKGGDPRVSRRNENGTR